MYVAKKYLECFVRQMSTFFVEIRVLLLPSNVLVITSMLHNDEGFLNSSLNETRMPVVRKLT